MRLATSVGVVTLLLALGACDVPLQRADDSSQPATETGAVPGIEGTTAPCTAPVGGVRLGRDSVAGFGFHTPIAELRRRCPVARMDTVSPGGYTALALRLPFDGVVVWAVSRVDPFDRAPGSPDGPPEFWYAEGDSARLADGTPIPSTVGALASQAQSLVLVAENADDTEGSYLVPCTASHLELILGYVAMPADTGTWRLRPGLLPDTMQVRRIRVDSTAGVAPAWLARLEQLCKETPVT